MSIASFNRKPFEYVSKENIFDLIESEPKEGNPDLRQSVKAYAFDEFWFKTGAYGEQVTFRFIDSPVEFDESQFSAMCMSVVSPVVVETMHKIAKDSVSLNQIHRGKAAIMFEEYISRANGLQVGIRFVDL